MKKQTVFLWGWNEHKPTIDKGMTRERMARLMRAWRRSRTQGHRDYSLVRVAAGAYRVAAMGERATVIVERAKP